MSDYTMVEMEDQSNDTIYQCGDCSEPFSNIEELVIHCVDKHDSNSSSLEIRTELLPETSTGSKQNVIALEDENIFDVDPLQKVLDESYVEIDPKQGVLRGSYVIDDSKENVLDTSYVSNITKKQSHLHQNYVKTVRNGVMGGDVTSCGKKRLFDGSNVKTGRKQSLLDGSYVNDTESAPDILILENMNNTDEIYVSDTEFRNILHGIQENEADLSNETYVNDTELKESILYNSNIGDMDPKPRTNIDNALSEQSVLCIVDKIAPKCDVSNKTNLNNSTPKPGSYLNDITPREDIIDDNIKIYHGSKLIYVIPQQKSENISNSETLRVYKGSKLLFETSEKSTIIPLEDNQNKINPCFLQNGNFIQNIPGKTTLYIPTNKECSMEFDNLKQFLETGESFLTNHKKKSVPEQKKFKCDRCGQLFDEANLLKVHRSLHTNGKLYQCDICNQSFNGARLLKIHKASHDRVVGKPYKCDLCNQSFFETCCLKIHKASHSGVKPYKCDVCDASFVTLISLLVHKESHEVVRPHKCDVCDKTFASLSLMNVHKERHMRSVSSEQSLQSILQQLNTENKEEMDWTEYDKIFGSKKNLMAYVNKTPLLARQHPCKLCDKQFFKKFNLEQHMIAKHLLNGKNVNKKHCKCTYCPEKFLLVSEMRVHSMEVHGEKPHKCDVCGKTFNNGNKLSVHMRSHTGERPFKCDLCDVAYRCQSNLVIHKRKHTGERPFLCEFCSATFIRKEILVEHRRKHTGERPFKCEVCGNRFATSSGLLNHRRMHTGEKPFICDVCGKSFSYKNSLKLHMRTHTGDKPFGCNVCGKSLSQKSTLVTHMRMHTGEKPYRCEVCGKAFALQNILNTHMIKHSGKKPFKCEVCEKFFARKGALSKHMRNSH